MRALCRAFAIVALALVAGAVAPHSGQAASDCACRDTDHNGVCDPYDQIVPQAVWIGPGAYNASGASFTIPPGCNFSFKAIGKPIQVTAKNVFLFGNIVIDGSGGEGVLFIAEDDVVVGGLDKPFMAWDAAGMNKLIDKQPQNTAIAKASIAFKAGRDCSVANAKLSAHPLGGNTMVGMQCGRNIYFRKAELLAAGLDIQAGLNPAYSAPGDGFIDASNVSSGGGTTLVYWCDPEPDGTINLPCTINTAQQLDSVCNGTGIEMPTGGPGAGANKLTAAAYPAVLIARGDVKLQSDSAAFSSQNLLEGRYQVTLVSTHGNIDLTNAKVTNTTTPLSGSDIWMAASPASVDRYSLGVMKEKFYGGCPGPAQIIYNANTCFQSPLTLNYCGSIAGNSGPSSASGCRTDLQAVTTGGDY